MKLYEMTVQQGRKRVTITVETSISRNQAVLAVCRRFNGLVIDARAVQWDDLPDRTVVEQIR